MVAGDYRGRCDQHASGFFAHPERKFGFDTDLDMAGKSRRSFLDNASHGKKKLLGYHWTYPGLGMAEVKDGAFGYVPSF